MNQVFFSKIKFFLGSYQIFFVLFFVFSFVKIDAQVTPGLIYEPATGAGRAVLDPDGDGYSSKKTTGFVADDSAESEIAYKPLVFVSVEPNSDLESGPNCGFTDFVDKGDRDPVQSYLDGNGNWLFRMRMGKTAPNAKSYSILIDTDGLFGGTGPNKDPQYSSTNPGFEIEIVLATKFGVFVYDVNNMNCTPVISYLGTTNYQKSVALTTSCGDPDYFYDFFVKFSDLASKFSITTSTPMRMVIIDNMAAKASTLCHTSSASDLAGIDDAAYGSLERAMTAIVNNYTPCTPGSVCTARSFCPGINNINKGATSVSGISSEASGTLITVYKDGTSIGSTVVISGVWELTNISPALDSGNVITATATAPGKSVSIDNCNPVTVVSCATVTSKPATSDIVKVSGSKGYALTVNGHPAGTIVRWYDASGNLVPTTNLIAPYNQNPATSSGSPVTASFQCKTGQCFTSAAYSFTYQEPGKCESAKTYDCQYASSQTATGTPTITVPVLTTSTSVSGTVASPDNVSGVIVNLYVNGVPLGTTKTGSGGAWTVNDVSLSGNQCQTLSVEAIASTKCVSPTATTTVTRTALAPIVNVPLCSSSAITTVSGTSAEAAGTVIQVYDNGTVAGSTTTVSATGTWKATGLSIALGHTITAKVLNSLCLNTSVTSNAVVVGTKSSNVPVINADDILECSDVVSGTGTNGDVIRLYIDGFQIGSTATVTGGTWAISGLSSTCDLYCGGVVTATASTGTNCEGNASVGKTVVCVNPSNSPTYTVSSNAVPSGSNIIMTVNNSENGVIYQIYNGASTSGSSKLGTGGTITLTSSPLTSTATLSVRAIRLGTNCIDTLEQTADITVTSGPTASVLSGEATICSGVGANLSIAITGGVSPYTVTIDNGVGTISNYISGTNILVNPSATTTYAIVSVKDANSDLSTGISGAPTVTVVTSSTSPVIASANRENLCSGDSGNIDLSVTGGSGTDVKWYTTSCGETLVGTGNPLNITAPEATTTYYARWENGSCYSSCESVMVTVNSIPSAPVVSAVDNCNGTSTLSTNATGSLLWSTSETTSSVTVNTSGTYTVTQTVNGCTSAFSTTFAQPNCIAPVAIAPVAIDDNFISRSAAVVSGSVATNDSDGNNTLSELEFLPLEEPTIDQGTIEWDPTYNGSFIFTPTPGYNGTVTIRYRVEDPTGLSDEGVLTIYVSKNDSPSAVNDTATTAEDTPLSGSVSGNDSASNDGGNVWSLVGVNGGALHGTVSMQSDGSYTYTPDANWYGTETIYYQVCDVDGDCSNATITITVNSVNELPSAVNDTATTAEDTPLNGSVSGNDSLSNDGGNVWSLVGENGGASHGTIIMTPDGSYTYTPDANWHGIETIDYQVCAADGDCSNATITITVSSVNEFPSAVNDTATTNEDSPISGNLATNDSPSKDGGNVWSLVGDNGGALHGTIAMTPDGSYTYTPDANWYGTETINYQVCDADGDCSKATLTITVNPVDEFPSAVNDTATTNEDSPISGNVSTNDSPSNDAGNIWSLVGDNGGALNGTITMTSDGSYTYTPDANWYGTETINYQICDVDGDCSKATLTITVNSVNELPSAVNDTATTEEDTPFSGKVSDNDSPSNDGENVWSLVGENGGALHGTITMTADGIYTYTPDANWYGTETINYQVCDGDGDCSKATLTITVNPVDEFPSAVNDTATTNEDSPISGNVSTNDSPSNDAGNIWSLVGENGGATHGTITMTADGSYTYTPDANWNGTETIDYQVCAADGDCSKATLIITINTVDEFPSAVNDTATTEEDTPFSGKVSGNDSPSNDSGNIWSLIGENGGALQGTITMTSDGSYTYTPDANWYGTETINYQVCDVDGDCSKATITITVSSVNEFPTAVNDTATTNEDSPISGTVSSNDSPSNDGENVWSLVGDNGGALHGTITMTPDGTYTYTPDTNWYGTETINYQICDADGDCAKATLTITVNSVNEFPTAVSDTATTNEDSPISGNVATNDSPSNDSGNVWSLVGDNGGALHGTVTMTPDGSYTYTADANWYGTETINYQVCAADGDCSNATITITVNSVNELPSAVNDTASTAEDTPLSGNVTTNDSSSNDGGNEWSLVGDNGGALHGTITMTPDGSYTYTPDANWYGTETINYQVCDGDGDCAKATLTITVSSVNEFPTAVNDTATTNEDSQLSGKVSDNDSPSNDGGNVWSLVGNNGGALHGTITMTPDGSYTYTPDANWYGTETINYQVCDADGDCAKATITITINPVDEFPSAVNDTATTNEDSPIRGSVSGNDSPSNDAGNIWSLVGENGGASHGTITMTPDGSYIYTPDANWYGTEAINYQVCDVDGDCAKATITITVNPVDEFPLAVNDTATTAEDTPLSGSVSGNDSASNAAGNIWSLVGDNGGALNGTITMTPDGSYTYTPDANWYGTETINYQVCDADGDCTKAMLTITVSSVNEFPSAVNDTATTNEDSPISGKVSGNDSPSNDGGNVWSLVGNNGGALHGTVTMTPDGSYTYTSDANWYGTETINYQVCDVDGDCAKATLTITVNPVNEFPSAVNDTATTEEDAPFSGKVSDNDSPSNDAGNVWSLVGENGGASYGTIAMTADGSYTYTPDANWYGTETINYQVCDGDGDCSKATLTITVSPVDEFPSAVNDTATTNEDSPISGNVSTNDSPSNDAGNVWSLVGGNGGALHGMIAMTADGSYTYTPDANWHGTETINYQVCDADGDCSKAMLTITVNSVEKFVENPSIALIKTIASSDENGDGLIESGEKVKYAFVITNTGNVTLTNITISDFLPGVVITGGPISLKPGAVDKTSFEGTYTITANDLLAGRVINTAEVYGTTPNGEIVKDLSDNNSNNGDESTVLDIQKCKIEVFNSLSPNGDGLNDLFRVDGLECYPENSVEIYNRWGVLVFERDNYNNNDRAFKGISEGRVTVKQSEELPVGVYFYVVKYKEVDSKIYKKSGYLYLNRK
ncbi:Ig-like domain-containing protein [Flavobacterium gilvum]|uniref:Tandem-95 repeat protein n=1 Tax=Flavobacterium gilvum TaxID=1492737 RepID=A0AAC9I4Q5_9FLAO|nr:Ig-like domain-containing protein [Flavobacterium gilvum]AOW10369.1 hypothetical protein EM308_13130 [Flavobacterium gilvum]KFC60692.1 hypothetical protein FEM08_05240 [Flavobacterium gilvum]